MIKKQREKQYAVFGLGRFGTSVALTLNELGYQVMGVDTDEDNVQRLAHELTHVVTADSSDERTLRSLGAQNFDVAVVAIGDLEANMLTTLLLKEIGVPVVVVKAINQVHGKMLKKIGADKIVYSERDMGQRVAHNLISNSIVAHGQDDMVEFAWFHNCYIDITYKRKKSDMRFVIFFNSIKRKWRICRCDIPSILYYMHIDCYSAEKSATILRYML